MKYLAVILLLFAGCTPKPGVETPHFETYSGQLDALHVWAETPGNGTNGANYGHTLYIYSIPDMTKPPIIGKADIYTFRLKDCSDCNWKEYPLDNCWFDEQGYIKVKSNNVNLRDLYYELVVKVWN